LVFWPEYEVPDGFILEERPWYAAASTPREVGAQEKEYIQTKPYSDAFSRESIISWVLPGRDDGVLRSPIVDIELQGQGAVHRAVILLTFVVLVVFATMNAAARRFLPSEYLDAWYWAWLCWAVLYATHCLDTLIRAPWAAMELVAAFRPTIVSLLSIANDAFFLWTGLALYGLRDERWRERVVTLIGIGVGGIFLTTMAFVDSQASRVRFSELLFSLGISIVLAAGLLHVIRRRGSLSTIREVEKRVLSVIVVAFFATLCAHQILILFLENPFARDTFYLVSVVIKVGLMSLFYVVVLADRYWEAQDVNRLMLDSLGSGSVAIDEFGSIVGVNTRVQEQIGLTARDLVGRDAAEVIFGSFFEYRDLLAELKPEGADPPEREVLLRDFGEHSNESRRVARRVRGLRVGERGEGRVFALFEVLPEAD